MSDKLKVREFDLDDMFDDVCVLIIAKRGSGKSWITRAILHNLMKRKIPAGIVISPTDSANGFFSEFFPDTFIHREYSPELMCRVLDHQIMLVRKEKEKREKGQTIKGGIRCFVVMDDCLASVNKWRKCEYVRDIMMNGRHHKLTFILTMQEPMGIPPELRTNFDYVFLLREESDNNLKKYYTQYASIFPNIQVFKKIFNKVTENFSAMVLINKGLTRTLFDKFAFYKAPALKGIKYKMAKPYRIHHKMNYNSKWEERMQDKRMNEMYEKLNNKNSKVAISKIYNKN